MKSEAFWRRYQFIGRIVYERDGDKWIASRWPLLSFGVGQTKDEATEAFMRNLHETWQAYSRARLSPLLQVDRMHMRNAIIRRDKLAAM